MVHYISGGINSTRFNSIKTRGGPTAPSRVSRGPNVQATNGNKHIYKVVISLVYTSTYSTTYTLSTLLLGAYQIIYELLSPF